MTVSECRTSERWDSFVNTQANAVNYHRWTWKAAIQGTFGHKPYYFIAEHDGAVEGVLPLFEIKSYLFGHSLVSMPFFTYGGVLARNDAARDALLTKAGDLANELRARHVELRQSRHGKKEWWGASCKVTMEVELNGDADNTFSRLNPKLRKRIRYALKNGLTAQWFGAEGVALFYPIFAANMRNLGTPVYPRKWFEALCQCEPKNISIVVLFDSGRPTAGAFLSAYRDTLEMPWAASIPESRKKFSPLLLYWSVIEHAHQNGFRKVDLGRCTPGSGNHAFKQHWATHERSLEWTYWLRPGAGFPELRPENSKFHYLVEIWKRLPMPVANGLGPIIVRSLP